MPIDVPLAGPRIYGHRSESRKKRKPNDKDRFLSRVSNASKPRPRQKPLIEIQAFSPYNHYSSRQNVIDAARRLVPLANSHAEVHGAVAAFLSEKLPVEPAGPTLILVGNIHTYPSSLSMILSVLGHAKDWASKQLLIERTEHDVEDLVEQVRLYGPTFGAAMSTGEAFHPDLGHPALDNELMANLYARSTGYSIAGFDPLKSIAPDIEAREGAMLGSINKQLLNSKVTIVTVGSDHLAYLHEKFSELARTSDLTMLALTSTDELEKGDTLGVRRASYALSRNDILKIRAHKWISNDFDVDPPMLAPPLDAVNYIRDRGLRPIFAQASRSPGSVHEDRDDQLAGPSADWSSNC
jgi:hypothetical protein